MLSFNASTGLAHWDGFSQLGSSCTAFTLAFWLKIPSQTHNSFTGFGPSLGGSTNSIGVARSDVSNLVDFYIDNGDFGFREVDWSGMYDADQFCVFRYGTGSGTNRILVRINGADAGSFTLFGSDQTTLDLANCNLYLGPANGVAAGETRSFAEVSLWNRALTNAECDVLYRNGGDYRGSLKGLPIFYEPLTDAQGKNRMGGGPKAAATLTGATLGKHPPVSRRGRGPVTGITQTAPVITSSTTTFGIVGTAFAYQIAATQNPTSYNATSLPSGLSVNTSTGLVSGTPTTAATSTITVSATNAAGTGNASVSVVVSNPGTGSAKVTFTHYMRAYGGNEMGSPFDQITRSIAMGNTLEWLYSDEGFAQLSDSNDKSSALIDDLMVEAWLEAARQQGTKVTLGTSGSFDFQWSPRSWVNMFQRTFNHSALFRIGGKPVYTFWAYNQFGNNPALFPDFIKPALTAAGFTRSSYIIHGHVNFLPDNKNPSYDDIRNTYISCAANEGCEGYVEFAVNAGNAGGGETNDQILQNLINRNLRGKAAADSLGLRFYGSASAFYDKFHEFGYARTAQLMDSVFASQPTGFCWTTGNDNTEISNCFGLPTGEDRAYIGPLNTTFTFGGDCRRPQFNRQGIADWISPWVKAFRDGTSPSFSTERLFIWHPLHPAGVPLRADGDHPPGNPQYYYDSGAWSNSPYRTGAAVINNLSNKVYAGAHLASSAEILIDGVTSGVKPAGWAAFEQTYSSGSLLGTHTVQLRRGASIIATLTTPAGCEIVNDIWPGGGAFFAKSVLV